MAWISAGGIFVVVVRLTWMAIAWHLGRVVEYHYLVNAKDGQRPRYITGQEGLLVMGDSAEPRSVSILARF